MIPRPVSIRRARVIDDSWYRIEEFSVQGPSVDSDDAGPRDVVRLSCRRGDRVGVLPYRIEDLSVALTAQFRLPVMVSSGPSSDGLSIEILGGLIDDDGVEGSARREAEEETGLLVEHLIPCGTIYCCPALVAERTHLFLAPLDSLPVTDDSTTGVHNEGEVLRCFVWTLSEAWTAIAESRITDAKTVIALTRLAMLGRPGEVAVPRRGVASAQRRRPRRRPGDE